MNWLKYRNPITNLVAYPCELVELVIFAVVYATLRTVFAIVSGVWDGADSAFSHELDWVR